MGKFQNAVNTASLVDGDTIAAYLTSAAGTLLTHTTIGAKEYADAKGPSEFIDSSAYATGVDYLTATGVVNDAGDWVPFTLNAAGELPVAATVNFAGDYAEDSAHTTGDLGLFTLAVRRDVRSAGSGTDGDYSSFNVNAVGEMWVKDADVLTELLDQGTTLDGILSDTGAIASDTATIASNTTAILADTATIDSNIAAILADTATIDSQTLSIQNTLLALSKAEDAAHASGDQGIQALAVRKDAQGTNTSTDGDYSSLQTWSEGSLKVVDVANGTILQQQVEVTNVAAQVPAANLANRKTLMLQNTGANRLWIGSATVTTSGATAGIEVPANSFMELECGPAVNVYAVKVGATANNLNVLEMA
jgi:hypothetical protein